MMTGGNENKYSFWIIESNDLDAKIEPQTYSISLFFRVFESHLGSNSTSITFGTTLSNNI